MSGIIIMGIALLCAAVSWGFAEYTRRLKNRMEGLKAKFERLQEFEKWAIGARIVVRDKASHEFVSDTTLYALYVQFQSGQAFRHAKMLYEHNDFKVFAQEGWE